MFSNIKIIFFITLHVVKAWNVNGSWLLWRICDLFSLFLALWVKAIGDNHALSVPQLRTLGPMQSNYADISRKYRTIVVPIVSPKRTDLLVKQIGYWSFSRREHMNIHMWVEKKVMLCGSFA